MSERAFTLSDAPGPDGSRRIGLLVFDAPGRDVNLLDEETLRELDGVLGRVAATGYHGLVITSGKKQGFIAGADLEAIRAVETEDWIRDPLDRFVLARLEEEGVPRSDAATLQKLLRRVTFDLTGLPPTIEELDAFLLDESPDAYERAVDRLLASPRYGEHMAAWWLDGARYADTNGYQNDFARAMWPWRDWVIAAFNANMPYDEFLTEQLAGDLPLDATLAQRVATGFNRNHRMVTEAGSIDEEWRVENVVDRVDTTATVFLGLTMGCARCHDHKYDPITQRDYYRFYAYFNNVDEKGVYTETRGNVAPLVRVPGEADEAELAELDERRKLAAHDLELREAEAAARIPEWEEELRASVRPEVPRATLHVTASEAEGPTAPARSASPHVTLAGEPGSFVDLGQAVVFEQDRAFSVSFWVKPESPESHGALLSKMADDDTYRGFDLLMLGNGRLLSHLIHDWPENAIKVETNEALATGSWTHVTYTYDGSRKASGVHLWFDGRDVPLKTHADTLDGTLRTPTPLRLGRRHYTNYFGGALADLFFFEGVLTPEEREGARSQRLFEMLALAETNQEARSELGELLVGSNDAELFESRAALTEIDREREAAEAAVPTSMVMAERAERRPTYLLRRGRYDAPEGEELEPGLPEFLGVTEQPRDRLQLARWLTTPDNPLTARVIVNQLWQRLFGAGLVETTENLGIQGTRPSHPELFDWLAADLVLGDWDLKALQRRIVTSATYRQSSYAEGQAFEADPKNRLLARGPRFRLSAEEIRDQALAVGGLLVERIGGPATRPYQPEGLWKELAGGAGQGPYVQDTGDGVHRRSLYTHRKRTVPHPELSTFDAPSFEICQARRSRTNTPLQALVLC